MKLPSIPAQSILGINFSGLHDAAIAIVSPEGETLFACALERLTRQKQDGRFPQELLELFDLGKFSQIALPYHAADAMPEEPVTGTLNQLHLAAPVKAQESFGAAPPAYEEILKQLPLEPVRFDHHLAHAALAFYLSPFQAASIFTYDAGALNCRWFGGVYQGAKGRVKMQDGLAIDRLLPVSRLYTCITALLGFTPNRHEGKITGLAAYGEAKPERVARLREWARERWGELERLNHWVNPLSATVPAAILTNPIQQRHLLEELADFSREELAACVQQLAEEEVVACLKAAFGDERPALCLSGGLFANVKVTQRVREAGFKRVYVSPPMTDDGLALGAALLAWSRQHKQARPKAVPTMFLGPHYTPIEARQTVKRAGLKGKTSEGIPARLAKLLAEGKTVCLFQGKLEFGPRSLGHRTILCQATDPTVNTWLNQKLQRTEFMPFAPAVLAEEAETCFEDLAGAEKTAEFMTATFDCTSWFKEQCPGVVHVDGTARPQLVTADAEPLLYSILKEYQKLTGLPAVINTSFNIHEEPIVCSPEDALRGFFQAGLDYLYLEGMLISAEENAESGRELLKAEKAAERRRPDKGAARMEGLWQLYTWSDEARKHFENEAQTARQQLGEETAHAEQLKAEAEARAAEFKGLEAELERQKTWSGELEQAKAYFQAQIEKIKGELEQRQREIEQLNTRAVTSTQIWQAQREQLEEANTALSQALAHLRHQLEEAQQLGGTLEQEAEEKGAQIERLRREAAAQAARLEEQHQQAEETHRQLEAQKTWSRELENAKGHFLKEIEEGRHKLAEAADRQQGVENALEQQREESRRLEGECGRLKVQIEEWRDRTEGLVRELEGQRLWAREQEKAKQSYAEQCEDARRQLEEARAQHRALERRLGEKDEQIERLEDENGRTRRLTDEWRNRSEAMAREVESLSVWARELEKTKNVLAQQCEDMRRQGDEARERQQTLERIIQGKEQLIAELQARATHLQEQVEADRLQLAGLAEEIEQIRKQAEKTRQQLGETEAQLAHWRGAAEATGRELEATRAELRQRLAGREEEIARQAGLLAKQEARLQSQAEELARQEEALARQAEQIAQGEDEGQRQAARIAEQEETLKRQAGQIAELSLNLVQKNRAEAQLQEELKKAHEEQARQKRAQEEAQSRHAAALREERGKLEQTQRESEMQQQLLEQKIALLEDALKRKSGEVEGLGEALESVNRSMDQAEAQWSQQLALADQERERLGNERHMLQRELERERERNRQLGEHLETQRKWSEELERAKHWFLTQLATMRSQLEARDMQLQETKRRVDNTFQNRWVRLGLAMKLLTRPNLGIDPNLRLPSPEPGTSDVLDVLAEEAEGQDRGAAGAMTAMTEMAAMTAMEAMPEMVPAAPAAPKVSVLLAEGSEAGLGAALETLRGCEFTWEAILAVEDPGVQLPPWAGTDARVRLIAQPGAGAGTLLRAARDAAQGEILLRVPRGGTLPLETLEGLVRQLDAPTAELALCAPGKAGTEEELTGAVLAGTFAFQPYALRKTAALRGGEPDGALPHGIVDWDFQIRLIATGVTAVAVPAATDPGRGPAASLGCTMAEWLEQATILYERHAAIFKEHAIPAAVALASRWDLWQDRWRKVVDGRLALKRRVIQALELEARGPVCPAPLALPPALEWQGPKPGDNGRKAKDLPLITIGIPCYNMGGYVLETLESALAQTYPNFEVLIVDDGSTDDGITHQVLGRISDPRVRVIYQENKRLPGARNTALKHAKGQYIAFLDADDLITPAYLEELAAVLENDERLGYVAPWIQLFESAEGVWQTGPLQADRILRRNDMPVGALFRRSLLERLGGYDESFIYGYEDWELWVRLAAAGVPGRMLEKPLFEYRVRADSMLGQTRKRHMEVTRRIIEKSPQAYREQIRQHFMGMMEELFYVERELPNLEREAALLKEKILELATDQVSGETGFLQSPVRRGERVQGGGYAVIIPTYQRHQGLEETVRACRKQNRPPEAIWIVDDGSTTSELLKLIDTLGREAGIRTLMLGHVGLSASINAAVQASGCEFCMIVPPGDQPEPKAAENLARALQKAPDFGLVYGEMLALDSGQPCLQPNPFVARYLVQWGFNASTFMLRREAWQAVGGFDTLLRLGLEVWDFSLKLIGAGWGGALVEGAQVHSRQRLTTGPALSDVEALQGAVGYIQAKHPKLFDPRTMEATQHARPRMGHVLVWGSAAQCEAALAGLLEQTIRDFYVEVFAESEPHAIAGLRRAGIPCVWHACARPGEAAPILQAARRSMASHVIFLDAALTLKATAFEQSLIYFSLAQDPQWGRMGCISLVTLETPLARVRPAGEHPFQNAWLPLTANHGLICLRGALRDVMHELDPAAGARMGEVMLRIQTALLLLGWRRSRCYEAEVSEEAELFAADVLERCGLRRNGTEWEFHAELPRQTISASSRCPAMTVEGKLVPWKGVARGEEGPAAKPLHIAFILPWLVIGGVERVMEELIAGLRERGCKVLIFTTIPTQHAWRRRFEKLTPYIYHLDQFTLECNWNHYLTALETILREHKIDLVYLSNSEFGYHALEQLKRDLPGLPIVDLLHTEGTPEDNGGYVRTAFEKDAFLDRHIMINEHLLKVSVEEWKHNPEKCLVIHNCVRKLKLPGKRDLRKEFGFSRECPVFGYLGRFSGEKRPLVFVEAAAKALAKRPDLRFLMVGNGDMLEETEQRIKALKLERKIVLPGHMEDVASFFQACTVLVNSSANEGTPITVLEGFSVEVPILAPRIGGLVELVERSGGGWLHESDGRIAERLAGAMVELAKNPGEIKRRGKAGRKFFEQTHDADSNLKHHMAMIEELVKRGD